MLVHSLSHGSDLYVQMVLASCVNMMGFRGELRRVELQDLDRDRRRRFILGDSKW